jgi:hypothetical protein
MIKRNHPSWYIPGAPMNIGDALKHLDDVEPDGSAVAYQDALEAVHTHIRRMGVEYTEQSRLRQLAADHADLWERQWRELNAMYSALFGAVERARAELAPANVTPTPAGGNYFKRPWDEPSPPLEPAPPRKAPPAIPIWSDEQFAKIKAEWEGFVPREGLGQGQPECTTCERRVQEGEQPPFPTVQARQWINHGGRVWTRLCEACKARKDPT